MSPSGVGKEAIYSDTTLGPDPHDMGETAYNRFLTSVMFKIFWLSWYVGCPELAPSGVGKEAIQSYTTLGLDPHAVGEAAYRLLINPKPPLRNLIMADSQWKQIIPMMCR